MGLFAGLFGQNGGNAQRAAGVVAAGQKSAEGIIKNQYDTTAANYQPYMTAGTGALGSYQGLAAGLPGQFNPILGQMGSTVNSMQPIINKLTSTNLNDYQTSPGYAFRMQQGQKALENSAAARGNLFSGATGKALTEYGQNFGTNDYQNYLSNLQGQLGAVNTQLGAQGTYLGSTINSANAEMTPYANMMQQGANMTSGLGQLGAGAAGQQAGYETGAANATAQGMTASSNALNNTSGQLIGLAGMAAGGTMGGMGMLGGASGAMGAMNGAQAGGNLMSGFSGNTSQPIQYQGAGYQPMQQQSYGQPQQPQQAYIQPQMQQPTAQYNGMNLSNPTQGFGKSNWNAGA